MAVEPQWGSSHLVRWLGCNSRHLVRKLSCLTHLNSLPFLLSCLLLVLTFHPSSRLWLLIYYLVLLLPNSYLSQRKKVRKLVRIFIPFSMLNPDILQFSLGLMHFPILYMNVIDLVLSQRKCMIIISNQSDTFPPLSFFWLVIMLWCLRILIFFPL